MWEIALQIPEAAYLFGFGGLKMRRSLVKGILLVLAALSAAQFARADDLYWTFNMASPGTWGQYTAPLSASGNWHVGSPTGSLASDAEINSVLQSLTALEIGGTGTATSCGANCFQSIGFVLSNPNLAGLESDDFTNTSTNPDGWSCAGDPTSNCPHLAWAATSGFPSGGYIEDFSSDTSPTQLLFLAGNQYLGNQSAAASGNFQFSFFALNGTEGTPDYNLASGVVILSNTPSVPEPSSLLLLGTGALGFLGPIRRKLLPRK